MKTIKIVLYSFKELSKEAQQKAINRHRERSYDYGYNWANEALESLKKFAQHFGAQLKDWEINFFDNSHSRVRFSVPDEPIKKRDLKKLILSMGSYNKRTLKGNGDCVFTGVCLDEDAADGARMAFLKDGQTDLQEILQSGFNTWLKACQADAANQISDKGIREELINNDQLFEQDGTLY